MEPKDSVAARFAVLATEMVREWRVELDRRLRSRGVTEAQWSTLYQLSIMPAPPTQIELCGRMGVEGPTMVRRLDRLEARELVERTADASDRRRKIIVLTSAGRESLRPVERIIRELRREFLAGVGDAELATCMQVLAKIRTNQDAAAGAKTQSTESQPRRTSPN